MVEQGRLVALDDQNEVTSALLHDRVGRLHLRVERIHQRDGAVQVQPLQQRLPCGDLVALVGHRFDSQRPSAARVDGSDQLRAPAAPDRLAIQHHHVAIVAAQAPLLPRPQGLLKGQHRHRFEHPINAVLRGRFVATLPPVEPAPKGHPLGRGQILGEQSHPAVASLTAREQIRKDDRQHRGLFVPQAMPTAAFGHLLVEHLPERLRLTFRQQAVRVDLLFIPGQGFGKMARPQGAGRMLDQFAHKQLLGPLMHLIKILRHALETGRAADRLPARRFVARATEELGVNKTFHRQNRMPVRFLPILRQSIQILPHHGAGQIGMFAGGDEQTETRVIRQQPQSPTPEQE